MPKQPEFGVYTVDIPETIADIASTTVSGTILKRFFFPYDAALFGFQVFVSSPTGTTASVGLYDQTSAAAPLDAFATITTSAADTAAAANPLAQQFVNSTYTNVYRRAGQQLTVRANVPTGTRLRGVRMRILLKKQWHVQNVKEGA